MNGNQPSVVFMSFMFDIVSIGMFEPVTFQVYVLRTATHIYLSKAQTINVQLLHYTRMLLVNTYPEVQEQCVAAAFLKLYVKLFTFTMIQFVESLIFGTNNT